MFSPPPPRRTQGLLIKEYARRPIERIPCPTASYTCKYLHINTTKDVHPASAPRYTYTIIWTSVLVCGEYTIKCPGGNLFANTFRAEHVKNRSYHSSPVSDLSSCQNIMTLNAPRQRFFFHFSARHPEAARLRRRRIILLLKTYII